MHKPLVLAITVALCMTAIVSQAQTAVATTPVKDLIRVAIEDGQASGWVDGSIAADFDRNIGLRSNPAAPIQVQLTRLERLSDACARLTFDFSRPGKTALAPDGKRYPQRIVWGMNICTNGMPGVSG